MYSGRKYGPCIERVYVHYPEGGNQPPLFGKVVFVASSIPAIVLGGKDEAKFSIESKTLWCKRYETRKARSRVSASASRRWWRNWDVNEEGLVWFCFKCELLPLNVFWSAFLSEVESLFMVWNEREDETCQFLLLK